jgi:hypothetical protein
MTLYDPSCLHNALIVRLQEVPDKYKSGNSRKGSPASTLVDRDDLPQAKEKSNGGGVGNGDYDLPPAIVDPEDPSLGRMTDVDLERNEKPRPKRNDSSVSRRSAPQQSGSAEKSEKQSDDQDSKQKDNSPEEMERELQKTAKEKGYIVVDWYNDDDPANPSNWSLLKKNLFTFEICFLTISIYMGSAIYSPGYQSIEAEFGISTVVASLGLTLFNKFPSFFDAICSFNVNSMAMASALFSCRLCRRSLRSAATRPTSSPCLFSSACRCLAHSHRT